MSLKDLNRRHLKLISLNSGRVAVRGGTGLLFFILVLTCGLLMAYIILLPLEEVKFEARRQGVDVEEKEVMDRLLFVARPAVAWAIGGGRGEDGLSGEEDGKKAERWTSYLLDDRPALLSAVFLLIMFSLPFLIAIGSFNQFSGDIATRGLRYQLLRTDRTNIFLGRFVGTAVYTILVMAFLLAVIVLYIGFKLKVYGWADLVPWGLRGLMAFVILSLPYVAFCSWFSTLVDSPFLSLVICKLAIALVPLLSFLGRKTWEPLAHLNFLMPWGVQNHLLHHDPLTILGAVAACLGYTAVFLFLGYHHFLRRDL